MVEAGVGWGFVGETEEVSGMVVARWPWLFTHDHLEGVCWTMSEFSSSAVVILYPV